MLPTEKIKDEKKNDEQVKKRVFVFYGKHYAENKKKTTTIQSSELGFFLLFSFARGGTWCVLTTDENPYTILTRCGFYTLKILCMLCVITFFLRSGDGEQKERENIWFHLI